MEGVMGIGDFRLEIADFRRIEDMHGA